MREKRRCRWGAELLSVFVRASICVQSEPACVRLEVFKPAPRTPNVCMYTSSAVYVSLQEEERKKNWQGQNVIELVSKWEEKKGRRKKTPTRERDHFQLLSLSLPL